MEGNTPALLCKAGVFHRVATAGIRLLQNTAAANQFAEPYFGEGEWMRGELHYRPLSSVFELANEKLYFEKL